MLTVVLVLAFALVLPARLKLFELFTALSNSFLDVIVTTIADLLSVSLYYDEPTRLHCYLVVCLYAVMTTNPTILGFTFDSYL